MTKALYGFSNRVRQVLRDLKVREGNQVSLARKERKGHRALLDLEVQRVRRDHQVWLDHQDHWDYRACQVRQVLKGNTEIQVPKVHPDLLDLLENPVNQVNTFEMLLICKIIGGLKVMPEFIRKCIKELREVKDFLVLLDQRDTPDLKVKLETLVLQDHQEKKEIR